MITLVRSNSSILQTLKDGDFKTGLYLISFDSVKMNPVPYEDSDINRSIFELYEIFLMRGVCDSFIFQAKVMKANIFQILGKYVKNTPYLIYFVNEESLEKFGYFINLDCDGKLRLCKDWRNYL